MYQVHRSTRDIKSQKTLPCYRSISHQRTCRIHDSSINKEYTQKSEYTEICFAGFQNSFLIQDSCQKADHPKRKHLPRSPWSLSHKHIGQHHDQASYKETCLAAKRMGVEKTVAEVENIDYIGMAESLDIGTVINKKMIAASHIYQMMLDADVSNVKCLTFANADVAEFTVPAGAKITRNLIKDLGLPKGTTIGGMIRNGEGVLVTGDTLIRPGDHVVVFCLSMMIKKIEKFFN